MCIRSLWGDFFPNRLQRQWKTVIELNVISHYFFWQLHLFLFFYCLWMSQQVLEIVLECPWRSYGFFFLDTVYNVPSTAMFISGIISMTTTWWWKNGNDLQTRRSSWTGEDVLGLNRELVPTSAVRTIVSIIFLAARILRRSVDQIVNRFFSLTLFAVPFLE